MNDTQRAAAWCALPATVLAVSLLAGARDTDVAAASRAAEAVRPGHAYTWLSEFQQRFPDRSIGGDAHRDAPEYVRAALAASGAQEARTQALATGLEWLPQMRNVIATIPGDDSSRSIVLAAHYDTVGGAPGAVDDGGAIAVLVEVARALAAGPPPACDIDLVVFDGEESGLLGSKAHVDALGDSGRERVRGAIALELVGWKNDDLVVHTIPSGFAWDAEGIAPAWVPTAVLDAGRDAGVAVHYGDPQFAVWYQPTVRLLGVGTGSDAGAYIERGIPSCMLAGSSLTHFYSGYHSSRDAMALVSPERLDDAARVAAAAVVRMAERARDAPTERLGDAYLVVFGRLLTYPWLALLALTALAPGLLGTRSLARDGGAEAAWALGLATGSTALLGLSGSVAGVLCGVPLVSGAAIALAIPPGVRLAPLLLGAAPLLVQGMLMGTAAVSFGLRWRGGVVHGILLALLGAAAVATIVLVRLHRPRRTPCVRRSQRAA